MTSGGDISERVRRLILEHIHSVEQLEILLLLAREPERDFAPGDVAGTLVTSAESVSSRLDDLVRRGLVRRRENGEPRYRFEPVDRRLQGAVAELGDVYSRRRVSVIGLIFSKPSENIVTFADAFRLRKDD